MKNFTLYTGNRLEFLVQAMAEVLSRPLESPMTPEIIVVQSKGMERWISMRLAEKHGICANIQFPFPNTFIYGMFRAVLPNLSENSPFDPGIMTWKIMNLLPQCISEPEFEPLKNYLGENSSGIRYYQVAERIADTFDQYLLFRPEWIFDWEAGRKKNGWQSSLWRKLSKGKESLHRAALGKRFLKLLADNPEALQSLPERVSVFGISTLPQFYINILDAVSRYKEVHLFLLNPCADYWGDTLSRYEKRKFIRKAEVKGISEADFHLGTGSSFLASMGMTGRDFFDLINEFNTDIKEYFQEPEQKNLLSFIQSDILHRTDRPSDIVPIIKIDPSDKSICIHSCHSPMRELEVLYDNLLDMFKNNSCLMPRDVLVMTPDIEEYAPYIQAVFDVPSNDRKKIPFSIADRGMRMESPIIDAFLNILNLPAGRFTSVQVLSILESAGVYQRFGLSEADLERIREWIMKTRIRWGVDEKGRSSMGLPELPENTWKAGMDRLLLGYAVTGRNERLFKEILPYDDIEGTEAAVLGQLMEFTDRLFSSAAALSGSRTLSEWSDVLKKILDDFFHPDENTAKEIQTIRDAVGRLSELESLSGFDRKSDIDLIRYHMESLVKKDSFGFGFITGGITFCAMLPMRSIPFKVICLLGINSGNYPRQSRAPGFDLMTENQRPGDRSKRHDDRYLFLESILSAREKLYLSYTGQSIQDNSNIPPSVLISELTDYISQGFEISKRDIIDDHILTRHRLQAFSPAYFNENSLQDSGPGRQPELFSYSEENCRTAKRLMQQRKEQEAFISQGLSKADETWQTIDLDSLCSFFANPCKFILNRRLGIYLEEKDDAVEEKESFELKGLDKYNISQELMGKRIEGHDLQNFYNFKKSSGELPHGTAGECIYKSLCREVDVFVEKISPYISESPGEHLDIELELNGFKLTGRIKPVYSQGLVRFRCTKIKKKDIISGWIYHLALNAGGNEKYPASSLVAGTDIIWEYPRVEGSREHLENLLKIYWHGIHKPVPFFPNSSWLYVENLIEKNKSDKEALEKAHEGWQGNDYTGGDIKDHYFKRCFSHCDPINDEFKALALKVFEPVIRHIKKR